MVTQDWVNIGLGNGLVPDGTKPLPEPKLTYHQSWGIHLSVLSLEDLEIPIDKTRLKIKLLNDIHISHSGQGPMG